MHVTDNASDCQDFRDVEDCALVMHNLEAEWGWSEHQLLVLLAWLTCDFISQVRWEWHYWSGSQKWLLSCKCSGHSICTFGWWWHWCFSWQELVNIVVCDWEDVVGGVEGLWEVGEVRVGEQRGVRGGFSEGELDDKESLKAWEEAQIQMMEEKKEEEDVVILMCCKCIHLNWEAGFDVYCCFLCCFVVVGFCWPSDLEMNKFTSLYFIFSRQALNTLLKPLKTVDFWEKCGKSTSFTSGI